ncbi:STAS domain-containing protein [Pelagibius sp.]|uniref:STAS domain-containing protein n=1 Tax=Pelagibius sp. TaxID=1931238 RepID=UPI00260BA2A1|nr:STAS domain-containing protein [Pelagibius sp.]
MSQTIREESGKTVVELGGEIDLDRAPHVRRILLDCVARGRDLLVDLSQVSYIDSSGIASLVEALQSAGKGGTAFGLVAVSPQALRVFELARLDQVFTIHPDIDTALKAAG